MKKMIITTLITAIILSSINIPTITVKAATTEYVDIYIPRWLTNEFDKGEYIPYIEDEDTILSYDSSSSWAIDKDNKTIYWRGHDGILNTYKYQTTIDTDYPNQKNYITCMLCDKKWGYTPETLNEVYKKIASEDKCGKYTIKASDLEKFTNTEFLSEYNFYAEPQRTYTYDNWGNAYYPNRNNYSLITNNNDKYYYDAHHSFLSDYDFIITHASHICQDHIDYNTNKNRCQAGGYRPTGAYHYSTIDWDNSVFTDRQVQPISNIPVSKSAWFSVTNIRNKYPNYYDEAFEEYELKPIAISDSYTGTPNYQTDYLDYVEEPTTEITTEEPITEQPTAELVTVKPVVETTTEVTTETVDTPSVSEEPVVTNSKKITANKAVYEIDVNGKSVTIVKVDKNVKDFTIKNTIKYNGKTYKVTKISANAFKKCKKLRKVVIGKNITSISKNTFKKCKKLKSIIIKGKKVSLKKNCFKGIAKNAKITVPKTRKSFYKKQLKKAGCKGAKIK